MCDVSKPLKDYDRPKANALHFAAEYNRPMIMLAICQFLKNNYSESEYEKVMNATDKKGRTPAMIAANEDNFETFKVMLQEGGVDENVKDKNRKKLSDYTARRS
mmetsp:Transcript_6794/g.6095  ORF Transcript_6794/g.6095 Transcript_6794/m.6095 type:complete len:104 (-) Transcript_6794:1467-1778(-)